MSRFRKRWSLPWDRFCIAFSGRRDDSKRHDETREELWKSRGILLEVAWNLPVSAMPCALSCWFFPRVQAMLNKTREILVISGACLFMLVLSACASHAQQNWSSLVRQCMRDTRRLMEISSYSLGGCLEIAGDCDAMCPLRLDLPACASHDGQTPKDLSHIWCDDA